MFELKSVDEVFASLGTSKHGLKDEDVLRLRNTAGFNELLEKKRSLIVLFFRQFNSILVYILFGALILSIVLPFFENRGAPHTEDFIDAIAIAAILLINAFLGFFQECKAENAIAQLRNLSAPRVRVKRNGEMQWIASRELVPGDIMYLEEGDKVSADCRVITVMRGAVDESSLTGESKPARKKIEKIESKGGDIPIGDRINMVFRGTVVTAGHFEVCVTEIGSKTEIGKIAVMVSEMEHPPTPLEQSMALLGKWLGIVVLIMCSVIFIAGIVHDLPIGEMLLAAASLAVSAVPEGLPAIVTVCLAIGVQRMIRRRALTRELQAIETLGSITVICTDKTGTLTENQMEVEELWICNESIFAQWGHENTSIEYFCEQDIESRTHPVLLSSQAKLLLTIGASCNNAHSKTVGDPTEIGLLAVAEVSGLTRLPLLEEDVPFSSTEKYMKTTHMREAVVGIEGKEGVEIKYLKGAPEKIISLATHELCQENEVALSEERKSAILQANAAMASKALRVLAMAYANNGTTVFVGLIGMLDPPRDGVPEAIMMGCDAGIRTVMITGDHALTAQAIAGRIGLRGEVAIGSEVERMSNSELQDCVKGTSIFARVSPEHKVRILSALQANGEIVAMGGDGVNDAPALKRAHVGFAMGMRGTDVARETAQFILTDDHYATVIEAIEEGRTIYDNIRKFVVFLLRANFDELAVVLLAVLMNVPIPFLPIHILIINLITDSLPAIALALEKPEPDVMRRPPRNPTQHILHGEYAFIIFAAFFATIATFQSFFWELSSTGDVEAARTLAVMTAIFIELFLANSCRSRRSLLTIGFFSNRYLLSACSLALGILLVLVYSPLSRFVHFTLPEVTDWLIPLAWGVGAFITFESLKWIFPVRRVGQVC